MEGKSVASVDDAGVEDLGSCNFICLVIIIAIGYREVVVLSVPEEGSFHIFRVVGMFAITDCTEEQLMKAGAESKDASTVEFLIGRGKEADNKRGGRNFGEDYAEYIAVSQIGEEKGFEGTTFFLIGIVEWQEKVGAFFPVGEETRWKCNGNFDRYRGTVDAL